MVQSGSFVAKAGKFAVVTGLGCLSAFFGTAVMAGFIRGVSDPQPNPVVKSSPVAKVAPMPNPSPVVEVKSPAPSPDVRTTPAVGLKPPALAVPATPVAKVVKVIAEFIRMQYNDHVVMV